MLFIAQGKSANVPSDLPRSRGHSVVPLLLLRTCSLLTPLQKEGERRGTEAKSVEGCWLGRSPWAEERGRNGEDRLAHVVLGGNSANTLGSIRPFARGRRCCFGKNFRRLYRAQLEQSTRTRTPEVTSNAAR